MNRINFKKILILLQLMGILLFSGCRQNKEITNMTNPKNTDNPSNQSTRLEKAIFGAGCFWGVEAAFRKVDGVKNAISGYSGGTTDNPTYKEVCADTTGHAEVVEVTYDPDKVSYGRLLDTFWKIHNPTSYHRQGPDVGSQYRSAIFCYTDQQLQAALDSKDALEKSGKFKESIKTEIKPAATFYPAEDYHQRYYEKHKGYYCPTPNN